MKFFYFLNILNLLSDAFNFPKIRLQRPSIACVESEEFCYAEVVKSYEDIVKNNKTNLTNTTLAQQKYEECSLDGHDGCSVLFYI